LCEYAGLPTIGLFKPLASASMFGTAVGGGTDKSSESVLGSDRGPWIWQLPPNGPVPVKLYR
jgi:hypothetical protein